MRGKDRYVCWDLDETLGSFRRGRYKIIPGLRPLIEGLWKEDIRSVITTGAVMGHPSYVLKRFDIRDLFDFVFTREAICDASFRKYYYPVAASLGIKEREAMHRMIVIGDSWRDAAHDLPLSFILNPLSEFCHAGIYRTIISHLCAISESWEEAHAKISGTSLAICDVDSFQNGHYKVDGITLTVGRRLIWDGRDTHICRLIKVHSAGLSTWSDFDVKKGLAEE
jgi:hypothetical protein